MNIQVLLALQTAKGTAVTTAMNKLSATDYNLAASTDSTASEALGSGRFERDGFLSKITVEGEVPVELNMEQLELLLYGAGYSTGSVVNTTDWEIAPDDIVGNWMTVGANDLDNNMFEYGVDCLINTLKISTGLQAFVTATAGFIGMDHITQQVKNTGTITPLDSESLICLGAKIREVSTDVTNEIESVDLTFDNKLEGKGALNSVYNKAIRANGRASINLALTFNEFLKASYIDAQTKQKANAAFEVELEFALVGDPTKSVVFTFPKCKVVKNERTDLAGAGGLSKEFNAYNDEVLGTPVVITFKNYTSII